MATITRSAEMFAVNATAPRNTVPQKSFRRRIERVLLPDWVTRYGEENSLKFLLRKYF